MDSVNVARDMPKPADVRFSRLVSASAVLAASPIVNSYTIILEAGHEFIANDNIALISQPDGPELYFTKVLSVSVNTLTVDTPIPFPFVPAHTIVTENDPDLNVDGSSTPVIFGITNSFTTSVNLIRFMFHITDATVMDDSLFGGLPALTRGIVLRKLLANGNYTNYWNVKTNGRFAELAYDVLYADKAPAGVYGFSCRLTYGGDTKHGTPIKLKPTEAIQLIIQDNLTGLLSFNTTAQGHFILE